MGSFVIKPAGTPLTVNLNNDHHYVVEKSEAEGIQEIRTLAIRAGTTPEEEFEEGWLYVQGEDKEGRTRSFWFEIGSLENPTHNKTESKTSLNVKEFLEQHGIKPKHGVDYHYHPNDYLPPNSIDWGTYYPSPADLKYGHISVYIWRGVFSGSISDGIVTGQGVWRSEWTGPDPSREELDRYENNLGQKAEQARALLRAIVEGCPKEGKNFKDCPVFYGKAHQDFINAFSNPWLKLRYQPFDWKEPSYQPMTSALAEAVKDSRHEGFFKMISEQLVRDNEGLEGEGFKIKLADPQTQVKIQESSHGYWAVQFRYVIDTNPDFNDGRIFLTDSFVFDPKGKYIEHRFRREFHYPLTHPMADKLKEFTAKYNSLPRPTPSEQKSFAEEVARRLIPSATRTLLAQNP